MMSNHDAPTVWTDSAKLPHRPLLEDRLWAGAMDAIHRIRDDLVQTVDSGSDPGPCLARGHAGIAVFLDQFARTLDCPETAAASMRALNLAADRLISQPMGPSLFSGFTGITWAIAVTGHTDQFDCQVIDEAILDLVSDGSWLGHFDVIEGIVGLGVYALERLPCEISLRTLNQIVLHLDRTAERNESGVTWKTIPSWMPPHHLKLFPDGNYNLGMAHGVPGVIAFLARARHAGIAPSVTNKLIDESVHWLLRHQLPEGGGFSTVQGETTKGRLAWCYGDPGIACGLLLAAEAREREDWRDIATDLARACAQRPDEESLIFDASVCHGAAGLAHLFHVAARHSNCDALHDAARRWFTVALNMQHKDKGIGGFASFTPDQKTQHTADPGFLSGASGIGLTLLSAIETRSLSWDRALLVAS